MKRLAAIIFVLLAAFGLTACSTPSPGVSTAASSVPGSINGAIFVSTKPPELVKQEISGLNRSQVIQYLDKLRLADRPDLEPSPDKITVIYAVFGQLNPGALVNTRWTVSRKIMPKPYSENYNYRIKAGDSQNPLIVLNGLFNENPGVFVFQLRVSGRIIATATKVYKTGLFQ